MYYLYFVLTLDFICARQLKSQQENMDFIVFCLQKFTLYSAI